MGGAASCRMYMPENDMKVMPESDVFLSTLKMCRLFVRVRHDGRNKKRAFAKLTARPENQHWRD